MIVTHLESIMDVIILCFIMREILL